MKYVISIIWLSFVLSSQSFALTIERIRQEDAPCTHAQVIIGSHFFQTPEHSMVLDIVTTSSLNIGAINYKETSDYEGCDLVHLTGAKLIIYKNLWAFLKYPLLKYFSVRTATDCVFDHTYLKVIGLKSSAVILHLTTRMRDAHSLKLIQEVNTDIRVVFVNDDLIFFLGGERLSSNGNLPTRNIESYEIAPTKTAPK